MAAFDIQNISVYNDNVIDSDIIRSIVSVNNKDDAFYIADIGAIVNQHKKWFSAMPKVFPHYALKCNPNQTVIQVLAAFNSKFDCASKGEIQQVMQAGVTSDRIIYANPAKPHSHIKFARKVGVNTMVVDNTMEVLKIKEIYPEAKLVIRIALESNSSGINLNKKFGCKPTEEIITLMNFIKQHDMHLQGFSFHLGSPCWDVKAFGRGIEVCNELINTSKFMGFDNVNLIDIGGGIPGMEDDLFYKIAESVNEALEYLDPSIEVISEPGRYYVESAFTLATHIHSKRILFDDETAKRHYYINDGVFGSFLDDLLGIVKRAPVPLRTFEDELFLSTIWGPTCDSNDCIVDNIMIQNLDIDDWIIWRNMGAYTISSASSFNGYTPSVVIPIIRKSDLNQLMNDIDIAQKTKGVDRKIEEKSISNTINNVGRVR